MAVTWATAAAVVGAVASVAGTVHTMTKKPKQPSLPKLPSVPTPKLANVKEAADTERRRRMAGSRILTTPGGALLEEKNIAKQNLLGG